MPCGASISPNPIVKTVLHVTKEFGYGPDFWSKLTRQAWDITKRNLIKGHVMQYVIKGRAGKPLWRSLVGLTYD